MPRPSIDYLNARAAAKPANGGTNYARHDRTRSAADLAIEHVIETERRSTLDPLTLAAEQVIATFDEFRSWSQNLPPIGLVLELGDDEIPF